MSVPNFSDNPSLYIGLAVPLLLIFFVAASVYLPAYFAPEPSTDFLYVTDEPRYGLRYQVHHGHLRKDYRPKPDHPEAEDTGAVIYRHKMPENKSIRLSFQTAKQFELNSRQISPDGYKVEYGRRVDAPFFFASYERDYDERYLIGHSTVWTLNVHIDTKSRRGFDFKGWILDE